MARNYIRELSILTKCENIGVLYTSRNTVNKFAHKEIKRGIEIEKNKNKNKMINDEYSHKKHRTFANQTQNLFMCGYIKVLTLVNV